jgi:hypothetical protein
MGKGTMSTVLVHDSANDRVATITRDVAAFHNGGPDLEEEHIRKFAEDSDDAEVIHSLWEDGRKKKVAEEAAKAAAEAKEEEKVTSADSATAKGSVKRRSWGPAEEVEEQPSAASEEIATVKADLFISPPIQPSVEEKRQLTVPWSSIQVPPTANDVEALTYVPGLVGEITEWIVSGAKRPNRVMALGVASVVVGTLIGHAVKGPTGSATHLYVIILAPTGYGKD